jgi:hypothetical protein
MEEVSCEVLQKCLYILDVKMILDSTISLENIYTASIEGKMS